MPFSALDGQRADDPRSLSKDIPASASTQSVKMEKFPTVVLRKPQRPADGKICRSAGITSAQQKDEDEKKNKKAATADINDFIGLLHILLDVIGEVV